MDSELQLHLLNLSSKNAHVHKLKFTSPRVSAQWNQLRRFETAVKRKQLPLLAHQLVARLKSCKGKWGFTLQDHPLKGFCAPARLPKLDKQNVCRHGLQRAGRRCYGESLQQLLAATLVKAWYGHGICMVVKIKIYIQNLH